MRKNITVALVATSITFILIELVLRISGKVPGQYRYSQWVSKVDNPVMLHGFVADANGIFKVDTSVFYRMGERLKIEDDEDTRSTIQQRYSDLWVHEVAVLHTDHHLALTNEAALDEYSERLRRVRNASQLTSLDSVIIHYNGHPINSNGFYSIPFDTIREKNRIKVMLLGDSFTWGHSTENKTSSFANTLLARGYWVYNTGISGVDVAQYLQVLKVYFDSILPDVVILNFYIGNDVSYHARTPTAGVPVFFSTNAGNIMSFQEGIQFTDMNLAYRNLMDEMIIPKTTWLNRLAYTTVFGTMAWYAALKLGIVHRAYIKYPARPEIPYCNDEILQVSQFCRSRGVPFVLSVIPNLENGHLNGVHSVDRLFDDISFVEPDMTVEMFKADDGHFTDVGHRYYADFLEGLIEEAVNKKADYN